MKKTYIIAILTLMASLPMMAQGVMDAVTLSSNQLKGSARYSAMAGAFGSLGGDISSIRQNPAGIGVYRSSELAVTAGFNFYENRVTTSTHNSRNNDFYFTGDNMGVVGVINFREGLLRNLNFGFAYNNIMSFDNAYRADWSNIGSSLTQLMASRATSYNCDPGILDYGNQHNPYYDQPWLPTLAYNTNLIYYSPSSSSPHRYQPIFDGATSAGNAYLINYTSGGVDEYDFNISGNVSDMLYWGVTLNVTNISYHQESYYGEDLYNITVKDNSMSNSNPDNTDGFYELKNYLHSKGYGMGAKIGIIYRPVNYLRFGVAFHSPTFFSMTDTYSAAVEYRFDNVNGRTLSGSSSESENQTDIGSFDYQFNTPWHVIGSISAVIGKWGIISADYEYTANKDMYYSDIYSNYDYTNECISNQLQGIHSFRLGAEYRVTPSFSVRAGYSFESAPLKDEYFEGMFTPQIAEGTICHYQVPGEVNNITCGLGYRINNISIDAAYVYRQQDFSIFAYEGIDRSMTSTIMSLDNHSIKLSLGYRF
jgi:hypothetical protein